MEGTMDKRYRTLRSIAAVYKILALVILIAGVVAGGLLIANARAGGALRIGIAVGGVVAAGLLVALPLFAFAQLINLLIAMEENTRATLQAVQQQAEVISAMASQPQVHVPPSIPSRPSSTPLPPREQIGG